LDVYDPNEDKGYDFQFRTRDIVKEEHADARGDVRGRYVYSFRWMKVGFIMETFIIQRNFLSKDFSCERSRHKY